MREFVKPDDADDADDVECARFANSLMDKMLAHAQVVDGKATLAMTPGMFWEAMTENGHCWICAQKNCVAHSTAMQRAAFESQIENMQPLIMQFAPERPE